MNIPILRTEMTGLTALPVAYLEKSRLRQTVEKVGMDSIDFEGLQGVFDLEWYKVFFIDERLRKLASKRRLSEN